MAQTAIDRKLTLRDKRAQGIAAMGLVNREGDRFKVTTPSLRGKRTAYEVWRDEAGRVRCSCLEFEEESGTDAQYRCEHILAVKHSLRTGNCEPVTKQASNNNSAPNAAVEATAHETKPTTKTQTASVKREEKEARFERESNREAEEAEAQTKRFALHKTEDSLAEHTNEEEQTMRKQNQTNETQPMKQTRGTSFAVQAEHETQEDLHETETAPLSVAVVPQVASVVPFQFTNTLRQLRQPIDPKFVKTREGWTDRQGNKHLVEYVEWHTVADLLDRIAPTWSHAVRDIKQIGDMVAVTAAITIDGVTREGVGTGTADNETGIKKAEHDALKRAAIKFGIARELYQRESDVIETQGAAPQSGEFPRDPVAKSMADLVTPKQLGMIRALAREAGVDVEEECRNTLRCGTDELSKRAASSFIDHLKGLTQERETQIRRAS